ncbi:hypothetical protein V6Z11_A10G084000 [Gossypium hirsutum]
MYTEREKGGGKGNPARGAGHRTATGGSPAPAVAGKEAWGANGMGSARFWAEEEVGAAWSRTWGNGARNPRVSGFPKNFLETWAYRALGF